MLIILLSILTIANSYFVINSNMLRNTYLNVNDINDEEDFPYDIDQHLNMELSKLLDTIEIYPEKEEDIKDNTFEGYLRNEFISLSNGKTTLHFEDYLSWRKEKGTFLYDYEIYCIFNDVVSIEDECSLMEFIEITRIIDEGS
tara:strand:+ start:397 stop:825 length:429 start_codon:yes stop_codon:yes gene_type:complete